MFRATILVVMTAFLLAAAGFADASNGRQRVLVDRFVDHYAFDVDCADFGPYAFSNEVTAGTAHVSIVDVLAHDGSVLQTVFHIEFTETDTNSVSDTSLRLHGAFHEVWDYPSNLRTLDGAVFVGAGGGRGTWVQDTGRITMTLDTRIAQFVAGPHAAFFAGGIDPVACAALAE